MFFCFFFFLFSGQKKKELKRVASTSPKVPLVVTFGDGPIGVCLSSFSIFFFYLVYMICCVLFFVFSCTLTPLCDGHIFVVVAVVCCCLFVGLELVPAPNKEVGSIVKSVSGAAKNAHVTTKMKLLKVNDTKVDQMTFTDLMTLLQKSGRPIKMLFL